LLDQLDDAPGDKIHGYMSRSRSTITLDPIPTSRRGRSSLRKLKVSRKEARKQDREGKKRRTAEYFSSTTNNLKRVATSPHPESHPPKKKTVTELPRPQSSDLQSLKNLSPRRGPSASKPKDARVVASSSSTRKPSSRLVGYSFPRSRQEEDEDRYIALLEAKLTPRKKSKNGVGYLKDIEDDGLGGE